MLPQRCINIECISYNWGVYTCISGACFTSNWKFEFDLIRSPRLTQMPRTILATSALPYANGPIHLGHLVEYIQTDIWTRFQRLRGHETYYVCAEDTHGTPIMLKARSEGISPEQLIQRIEVEHRRDFSDFHIAFDNYHSTHSEENRYFSETIYQRLLEKGHIEKRTITQAFDPVENMFLPDRFIRGTCPKCGAADQNGDSCESLSLIHI